MIHDWTGKRVTVMGLGRFGGGVGVTRWLVRQGARVTLTDQLPAEQLAASLGALRDLAPVLHLGGHQPADFQDADLVVVNPAVRDNSPYVQAAQAAGVPVTTEINLFVERCPAPCVGITGSVGKSTTTAMLGHILQAVTRQPGATPRRVWVGGNIGCSLLEELAQIRQPDVVVLELSSFQLQRTPLVRWSPHIAVLTNVSPNHLDWHGSFAAYLAAKLNIVRFQDPRTDAIVIGDDATLRASLDRMFGDLAGVWRYRLENEAPAAVCQTRPAVECDDRHERWPNVNLGVPGRHNRLNAAAALTVAHLLGIPAAIATEALASFEALPDRLQGVGTRAGVTYYNDSKSTTPTAALTALEAITAPLLLIAGGYDKGSDLSEFARVVARRAKLTACIGQTGPHLAELIAAAGGRAEFCAELDRAVERCREAAAPGDVVLLSPACASWDQFEDYRARGALFTELAIGPGA